MRLRLTRRQFLWGLGSVGAVAAGGGIYTRFGEPHWLEVTRRTIPLAPQKSFASAVRLVHLSDFHASEVVSLEYIGDAISQALAEKPDVIAITGDFFTDHLRDSAKYTDVLRRLSASAPTFACLGNHDGGPWTKMAGGNATTAEVLALLRASNITCLHNSNTTLTMRGRSIQLFGVGDLWSDMCEPVKAFDRAPARGAAFRILLNHNPDAKQLLHPFDWDLMLCGHTHGGQVRLPILGTPFAPVQDRRYVEGLHRWENRWLYITRGVGNLHGVRFNCRPEISVLEIV
jgi:predicted MPP superfamily phosphohydrolase